MSKLEMVFKKENESRGEFCSKILGIIRIFLNQNDNGLLVLFLEIIRNIYDHADGQGKIVLIKNLDSIKFIIFDFGKKKYNLIEIKNSGSTKEISGLNFGAGICGSMIDDISQTLDIKLKIGTTKGFRYEGIYYLK